MRSLWSDKDAQAAVARYAGRGVNGDVALRVYTTRLLGGEKRLVLHGGGNTSVKTHAIDLLGEPVEVIAVKGSGWDMATIEPEGLPAVRLEPLRRLIALKTLTDEDMVNAQRSNLLLASAPTPSVETLLHAFLPHKFIDHTHANAVLALTDQPGGETICREVYGDRVAILPYIAPGFDLAKAAHQAWEARPECEGLILVKHGIFTFGESAREAYERMIDLVTLAEKRIERGAGDLTQRGDLPRGCPPPARLAPLLRGLAARAVDPARRVIVEFRTGPGILEFVNGAEVARYAAAGVVTPDHAIRIKPWPIVLPPPHVDRLGEFAEAAGEAFARYVETYRGYFERNNARFGHGKIALDPVPRIALVPDVGLYAFGASAREARVAADVAESAIDVIRSAETIGRFESITEAETFDMEYWSLEQAKLGRAREGRLARHVALVTGGAGTIGHATAAALAAEGAEIALLDRNAAAVRAAAEGLGGLGIACDVTSPDELDAAIERVVETYGGIDIVVSNAGGAWQGRIGEVSDEVLRRSFEVNFFAHQAVAARATRVMLEQGTGGSLLFNVSKQAVNPGPDFGPYGLPKAATMALVRQYALDYGAEGIRANGVNADRIRGGMLTDAMIRERAAARGVSEAEYLGGNLLGREVTAADVAGAFVSLALAPATTGAIVTVDGGNIAAALR